MTQDLAGLANAADELAAGPDRASGEADRQAAFDRWAKANAPGEPLTEHLLLRYLFDHPHWAPGTAKSALSAIDRRMRRSTGASPTGELTRRYLEKLRDEHGGTVDPLVPALRLQAAKEIAQALDSQTVTPALDALCVRAMRDGLVVVRHVAAESETIKTALMLMTTLHIGQHSDAPVLLVAENDEALQFLTIEGAQRWRDNLTLLTNRKRVRTRVKGALARAGIDPQTTVGQLSDDQWGDLWRQTDPTLRRTNRDRAYLLLGFAHARRHIELRRLNIQDVVATDTGYRLTYWATKNGQDYIGNVDHIVDADKNTCVPHCAACAVDDVLDWERNCMHRTSGPLLATRYAGRIGRMTRQNGRNRIRELTSLISPAPWGSTRSLRAGAATSAWEAGLTLPEIADLTGHLTLAEALRYVRRNSKRRPTISLKLN